MWLGLLEIRDLSRPGYTTVSQSERLSPVFPGMSKCPQIWPQPKLSLTQPPTQHNRISLDLITVMGEKIKWMILNRQHYFNIDNEKQHIACSHWNLQ